MVRALRFLVTALAFSDRDDTKEQVRSRTEIVELIGAYMPLRRAGAAFKGLCPFHDDSSPSLQVNPAKQIWRCFVCDIGGDAFDFIMRREGIGFREALEMLAERAGIELKSGPKTKPGSPNDRATLLKAMAWAERQFHEYLVHSPAAEAARVYLDDRGISESSIQRFQLGFAPNEFHWLHHQSRDSGFTPEVLQAAGLLRRSERGEYYDFYRGRVMFSIRDEQSRPIACGGRILPELDDGKSGKYVNSPETRLFNKSEQLYAYDLARKDEESKRSLVVVEGYTDVVMAHQFGVQNVVAVLGTALTARHVKRLKRTTDRVYLVLDGDGAGQRRTSDVLDLFVAEDVDLHVVTLPEGSDPCDFVMEHGADGFRQQLEGSVDALEHRFRVSTQGIDLARDTHRANQALEQILDTLAKAPSVSNDSGRQLRRQQMLARLARLFRVQEDDIRKRLRSLGRSQNRMPQNVGPGPPQPVQQRQFRFDNLTVHDRELLELLLDAPQLRPAAQEKIVAENLDSIEARQIFSLLIRQEAEIEFASILTQIDDSDLTSILVRLDEDAGKKSVHAQMDAPARLEDFIKQISLREITARQQESGQALEGGEFATQEEENQQITAFFSHKARADELARLRQGMSDPTDG